MPLDKRCGLNSRSEPETLNPKFAQLSETLYISTKLHREALEDQMKAEKLIGQKEKQKNEEKLRLLAQQARQERALVQRGLGKDDDSDEEGADSEEVRERRRMREERHRERVRNVNVKANGSVERTKFDRQRERDISEQIALGMARPNTQDNDVHDQRLYNQSQGLGAGFGDEDDYAVYDKAWKSQASFSVSYRPTLDTSAGDRQEAASDALKESREADDGNLAPIQFEKDVEDVFNVESFLRNAKYNARKSMQQDSRSSKRQRGS